MIKSAESTKIAYRCPYCGCVISANVNVFMLTGGFKLECIECHKSALEMSLNADGKVRLLVPCLVCPHPHPYTVSKEIFFEKDIFLLSCSYSGLDICFIGDEDKVEDELDRTESLIMDLLADAKDDENAEVQSDMLAADTNVIREVLFALDGFPRRKRSPAASAAAMRPRCLSTTIRFMLYARSRQGKGVKRTQQIRFQRRYRP